MKKAGHQPTIIGTTNPPDIGSGLQPPKKQNKKVKRGKWQEHFVFDCWHYDCPFCDDGYATKDKDKTPPNYCQNCGARLLGKESDNNAEEKCNSI